MNYRTVNRALAGVAFLVTFITYAMTLQPSVPFWDCGEFSAAATWQQVPHPPGAPLWLIVGRVFQLILPGDPGWSLNLFSAFCSSITAALVYLVIVQLIERWRPYREGAPIISYLSTIGAGLIGTLAFTWSDTQWFNSVESEVYAGGTTLIALLVWLMMVWDSKHDKPGHERYILLMAYVCGLAIGVHLLALLMIPAIALVIYFRNYKFSPLSFVGLMAITGFTFLVVIYKGMIEYIPKMIAGQNMKVSLILFSVPIPGGTARVLGVLAIIGIAGLIWWSLRNRKSQFFLAAVSFLMIFLGFTTYVQILLRANAHPPMNENEPDTVAELVSYLGREQYGQRPSWPRRIESDGYYSRHWAQYGEPWSPPRYEQNPEYPEYSNNPAVIKFDQINTPGELNYMFQWQLGHMYFRYLFWNFVGRVSDVQDAGFAFGSVSNEARAAFITPAGSGAKFPVQFYALPLLLGIFGLIYHFRRDPKMATVFLAIFLFQGAIATLQQNQQQPQPRERDYFYVGSFMVFAMWIGLGASAIAEAARKRSKEGGASGATAASNDGAENTGMVFGALALCFIAVPINMCIGGWKLHDRSHNWTPWDFSYNVLQSCQKDAILFTNGDNDTFPLWYLQDVAGVRRDVRVVNLELAQTNWYMWQMQNEQPWGAKKIPLSWPAQFMKDPEGTHPELGPREVPAQATVAVPAAMMQWGLSSPTAAGYIPPDSLAKFTATDGAITWPMSGQPSGQGRVYAGFKQIMVKEILTQTKWERPIYFSATTYQDAWGGLEEYLRREGMAYRVMPVRQKQSSTYGFAIEPTITKQCAMQTLKDDESYQTPHFGFKLRNMNTPDAFFLEDHRQWIPGYWELYISLALDELNVNNNPKEAVAILNKLESLINPEALAMPYWVSANIAETYSRAGDSGKAKQYAERSIAMLDQLGEFANQDRAAQTYNPTAIRQKMQAMLGGK
ncbi:MAG: DUF2723 domain-containing protein [Chlorobi bacterium]|nr:DUF2723 domain-containing protein [Chlorobiota bacterium]